MAPNILLIIAHDLGTHLGCHGEASVGTPVLDELAAEGARCANHFCTAPYCSPSRGGIFTGQYPHCNGLMGLVNLGWDLPETSATLGQMLAVAGYETYLFGLQHEVRDESRLGTRFDHVSDRSLGRSCDAVAPLVVDFLDGAARENARPFYARVGFSEVHRPYERYEADDPSSVVVPPYLADTPGARQDLAMFQGAIRCLDSAVGHILEALGRSGQRQNTIVVFTTDHGIAYPRAKATLYDPGLKTALILRWPERLSGGRVFKEMLSNIDLLPTLLEASGVPVPVEVQGRSFWSLLDGGRYAPNEQVFAEKSTTPEDVKRCIRTDRWKYIRNYRDGRLLQLPTDIEASLTRRDMGDDHLKPRPPVELYDLESDPREQENLAGESPTEEVERNLAGRLDRFLEETGDPALRGPIPRPPEEAALLQRARQRVTRAT
ncbi:sulfatase [Candidatus Latescibacterota bacterium]